MNINAKSLGCFGALLSILANSAAGSSGIATESAVARRALQSRYVGVRTLAEDDAGVAIYGRAMNADLSPAKAATAWVIEYAGALGVERPQLQLIRTNAVGAGRATVFAYQQAMDGLPVEYGLSRVLVRHNGRIGEVVYAAASLVNRPADGFPPVRIAPDRAVASVRAQRRYSVLPSWSQPALVVIADESLRRPAAVRSWKFYGWEPAPERMQAYTFFVDASNGRLVHVRDEIHNVEVAGTVSGLGSPDIAPDAPGHAPVALPLVDLLVRDTSGASGLTDAAGNYVLDTLDVGIFADLAGPWVSVQSLQGENLSLDELVNIAGPTDFLFNANPVEFSTAQVNAYVHTVRTHNFYADRQPDFAALDRQIGTVVNIPASCNAFFNSLTLSLNFYSAGSCVNTAYSTVIAHEYGHFIVDRLGPRQQSFGEGFGDAVAMLSYDDPVVGLDFFGPGTAVRSPALAGKQYPCLGEIHDCGQVLAGVWWDLKLELEQSLGAEIGLEAARQLFTDWSQITIGIRFGRNSATPLTAVEVLAADDDDGDLRNGTPHLAEICDAFAAHGIACPNRCEAVEELRLRCRPGTFRIQATILTVDAQGSQYDLELDASDVQTATINSLNRGTARWDGVASGLHEVCLSDCDLCASVACEP